MSFDVLRSLLKMRSSPSPSGVNEGDRLASIVFTWRRIPNQTSIHIVDCKQAKGEYFTACNAYGMVDSMSGVYTPHPVVYAHVDQLLRLFVSMTVKTQQDEIFLRWNVFVISEK